MLLRAALLACLPAAALAAPEGWAPLLEPADLAALLDTHGEEIRVVQVSGDYTAGHIPGAVWSPYGDWRGLGDNPGALRDLAHLQGIIRDLGIEPGMPVALVHAGTGPEDMGSAARVFWTLRALGVADLALLNGGTRAWAAAGLPLETEAASYFPSEFTARWDAGWQVTTAEAAALAASGEARLLDTRPEDFHRGRAWVLGRPGTIRGAENLDYHALFDGARMLDAAALAALARARGYDDGRPLVTFCNAGHWSALSWFAFHELAGLPDVRLYPESMAEYGTLDLPMDHVPGRLTHYLRMTGAWLRGLAE